MVPDASRDGETTELPPRSSGLSKYQNAHPNQGHLEHSVQAVQARSEWGQSVVRTYIRAEQTQTKKALCPSRSQSSAHQLSHKSNLWSQQG